MRRERLVAARKVIGKTQEQVAEEVGVDRTTIGTWERGEYTPAPQQRPAYANALGVSMSELDGMLTGIATEDRTPLWASQFLGMEQSATGILAHEPHAVHGLFQTPAYAAGIARTVGVAETPESYVQRNVEQRRWRQARVLNGDLTLHVIQPEIPLRMQIGDRPTMAEQMDRLIEMAHRPNITIQIVPFSIGQYEALRMGSVSIMTHPWVRGVSVYLVEHRGLAAIEDAEEAANYIAAVEQAADLALSPAASLACIEEMAKLWRRADDEAGVA
jgi:transcriptional regulator with XRE-family HTH domain